MKITLFLLSLFFLSSCATKREFPDKDVCFLLYDLKKDKYEEIINEKRCEERFPAASTFKVALSVMGFDSGVLKDEKTPVFKWDGKNRKIEGWNKDQDPTSWMRESAVWVSQEITPRIGMEKIIQYLIDFEYGNEDMTSGLKYAWLTPAPFVHEPIQNSLKISGKEQVNFLKKLWRGELKASPKSQQVTLKLLAPDQSSNGNHLIGKTGSGFMSENLTLRLGWYVGYLQTKNSDHIVVINFTDKKEQTAGTFAGREAMELAVKLLNEKGLW